VPDAFIRAKIKNLVAGREAGLFFYSVPCNSAVGWGADVEAPMDVSLLKLKSMFRHAGGRKGTLLAQALRKQDARQDAAVVIQPSEPATQPAGEQVRVRERSLTST
jgi:hypothetical protein